MNGLGALTRDRGLFYSRAGSRHTVDVKERAELIA